ncbi:MAG TPA: ABC transporter substrate-binding protein [Candidatus Binatia bacterium]|jgi:NitT/TauT family transport system substrate-binding protein
MPFPYRYLTALFFVFALSSYAGAAERLRASYAAPNASQSPLWAAQARGYFAKYGLEVDLLYISSGSLNVQALVGNTVQFAAGGPAALEARLRGPKLLTIANPLNVLASNLVTIPEIKSVADLKGKIGGISRFGSSTHQGLRYLFRTNGLSVENDLKMLQLGGDASRLAALKAGKIQYTFLGAAASEQARGQGLKVLATAQQMNIPFPWTSVVVNEPWLEANRDTAYRYVKAVTEAIHFMKHNRAESEKMIAKYMRLDDPRLAGVEYEFNVGLFPDLPYPTLEGMKLILENLAAETPEFARHKPEEFVDSSLVERLKREKFLESLK